MPDDVAPHLGGHSNKTHIDGGVLRYLIKRFGLKSMLDIGCGPGGMVELARTWGMEAIGIDGDSTVHPDFLHDYAKGKTGIPGTFDLAWSVEFLEHVEERFIPHFMPDFRRCRFALVTFAPPGKAGHHHVNCRPANYWIAIFAKHGFMLDFDTTMRIRRKSTMYKPFIAQNGLFFERMQ